MGPLEIGSLQPEALTPRSAPFLTSWEKYALRRLPGRTARVCFGLEQLTPARFNDQLRLRMQEEALDEFLDIRVKRILAGEAAELEPLHYDRDA